MQIRPLMIMVPFLATISASTVVQAIGEPSFDARAAARSSHADLAQLEAPTGHRQPTLDDLPQWLRREEKPGTEATQAPQAGSADIEQKDQRHGQRRAPRARPDDGVPRICDPC